MEKIGFMKIVKLTFNYDFPIFRQTPNYSQIWGDYKFIISNDIEECDFWVIYTSYNLALKETVRCNKNNIIFISGEAKDTSPKYSQKFLNQFGAVITVQRELKHKNILFIQNALPWFINKSFDELNNKIEPKKTKLLSIISSDKTITEGHRKRLKFTKKIKSYFGDKIDVYGRGINDFEDKSTALSEYKYSIAIENTSCDDYVTEKFFDCLYSNTFVFYYGCPNLSSYVDDRTFVKIDIDNIDETIKVIEQSIFKNLYEDRKKILIEEKIKSIHRDQFFPFISNILNSFDANLKKEKFTLKNELELSKPSKYHVIQKKIKNFIKKCI